MARELDGEQFEEIRKAIVDAFSPSHFDRFLHERLDFKRANKVANANFEQVAYDVLDEFLREGREVSLITQMAIERPSNDNVLRIYEKYARPHINDVLAKDVQRIIQQNEQSERIPKQSLPPPQPDPAPESPERNLGTSLTEARLSRERIALLVAVYNLDMFRTPVFSLGMSGFWIALSMFVTWGLAWFYRFLGNPGELPGEVIIGAGFIVGGGLTVIFVAWAIRTNTRQRDKKLAELAEKFPVQVRDWGGLDNLKDRANLKRIIKMEQTNAARKP
jgi:hypothetical protein